MTSRKYVQVVRRYWVLILVTGTLGLGIGVVMTALTPKQYNSNVTFFVKTASDQIGSAYQGDQFGQRRVTSYVQLLGSEELAQRVVSDLQLQIPPSEVSAKISAKADPNTVVLNATVTDTSPERSLAIAESVSRQLVDLVSQLETPQGASAPTVSLVVITGAALDPAPASPNPVLYYGLGLLSGLAVGLLVALVLERRDSSVRSVDSLEYLTGVPALGVIPYESSFATSTALVGAAR